MKPTIAVRRASHVNTGTAVPRDELAWPEIGGRVSRLPRTHVEVDERSEVTPYGGLAIATAFLRRFKVAECIDRHVQVFLLHLPYHESDHVLAQALNLYAGGTCIEDIANLQHSVAVLRFLGASRIPDPTTAGDFLCGIHSMAIAETSRSRSPKTVHRDRWSDQCGCRSRGGYRSRPTGSSRLELPGRDDDPGAVTWPAAGPQGEQRQRR